MKKLHIFTSAACNYIPKVRMLFNSLREFHPEAELHLLLADAPTELLDLSKEPFDTVTSLADMEVPHWQGWAFCHSIVELATAMKPLFLQRLLARDDCDKVLYLDPDMVVFSRLDDILQSLDEANITLTPHQVSPEQTIDAIIDNELSSLKHGVYNLGFVGVANKEEGHRFAAWWAHRTYHFCRAEIPNGLFTDQRWIDLVPAFFTGVAIQRSSRHNVATWNITTRDMTRDVEGRYLMDGEPLGFYHFTGFDSGAHKVMAVKNAPGNVAVHELVKWYEDSTRSLSQDPLSNVPWAFGTYSNGTKIGGVHRFLYRQRQDLQRAFPNPFDASTPHSLLSWMTRQGPLEYPALFDPATSAVARVAMAANVGLIFDPEGTQPSGVSLGYRVAQIMQSPSEAVRLVRRGYEVLRTEGLPGVRRRLG
ncbi:glycosyl transferase [Janthinobacterium sp.]|uniref:glycosyl transferase n=1 Tax=Janthinobacterium sp. TaxID=1871054 RepID=UPI00293D587D|nr:glycosyl transferase [Janthinobacterium sp.]